MFNSGINILPLTLYQREEESGRKFTPLTLNVAKSKEHVLRNEPRMPKQIVKRKSQKIQQGLLTCEEEHGLCLAMRISDIACRGCPGDAYRILPVRGWFSLD